MILTSAEIKPRLHELLSPVDPDQEDLLEGGAYDLRVGECRIVDFKRAHPWICRDYQLIPEAWKYAPHTSNGQEVWGTISDRYMLLTTVEEIHMPADLRGLIFPKMALVSCGLQLLVSAVAPGYHGKLTFGLVNHGILAYIGKNARIASIVFARLTGQENNQNA